jgi:hypothetical protein
LGFYNPVVGHICLCIKLMLPNEGSSEANPGEGGIPPAKKPHCQEYESSMVDWRQTTAQQMDRIRQILGRSELSRGQVGQDPPLPMKKADHAPDPRFSHGSARSLCRA